MNQISILRASPFFANPVSSYPQGGPSPIREEITKQAMPKIGKLIGQDVNGWSERFGLNMTGPAADRNQKVKDLKQRAFAPSISVLHMVHAYVQCAHEIGPSIGSDHVDAMLLNADRWIWSTIEAAEQWRNVMHFAGGFDLRPDMMIKLVVEPGQASD